MKYEDNDSLNQQYIEDYHERVKANPMIEYWKLPPDEMRRLYQEYLKSQQ